MQINTLSILVPIFNEAQSIPPGADRIRLVGESVQHRLEIVWNVVFVDDGSIDNSWQQIESLRISDPRFTGIKLSRNFGKEAALCAGLEQVDTDMALVMDSDLQHPPEIIPAMVAKMAEGFERVLSTLI